ncbi:MAG: O-methyltransferase [Methanoregulaceae archaeon]|jgi:hypothetical protein
MSGPPYHLRINKAADRFALIEAIRLMPRLGLDLKDFTYLSFGGSYLEDMRLMYEFFPQISMISVDKSPEVCKRQEFHRPCGKIRIENCEMGSFIDRNELDDEKCIVWLDYTNIKPSNIKEFQDILRQVAQGSIIKITLQADPRHYWKFPRWEGDDYKLMNHPTRRFKEDFEKLIPNPSADLPRKFEDFAFLIQEILQIAAGRALEWDSLGFYPVSSFYYSDGTWMFTLTGLLWPHKDKQKIFDIFQDYDFSNLTWDKPRLIKLPHLSTKERMHLQNLLPCRDTRVAILRRALNYSLEDNDRSTEEALAQYAAFHRYYPYYLRGVP